MASLLNLDRNISYFTVRRRGLVPRCVPFLLTIDLYAGHPRPRSAALRPIYIGAVWARKKAVRQNEPSWASGDLEDGQDGRGGKHHQAEPVVAL